MDFTTQSQLFVLCDPFRKMNLSIFKQNTQTDTWTTLQFRVSNQCKQEMTKNPTAYLQISPT